MLTLCGVTSGMASQGRGRRRLTDAGLQQAGFDRRLIAVLCIKHNSCAAHSVRLGRWGLRFRKACPPHANTTPVAVYLPVRRLWRVRYGV